MNTTLVPFTGDALVERAGRTFVLGIASTSRNAWRNSRAARDPTAHCRGAAGMERHLIVLNVGSRHARPRTRPARRRARIPSAPW
jgi:hypothetical protein